jgi:uncharacterized protein (DUF427 family)
MSGHRIDFHPEKGSVKVIVDGTVIADTNRAMVMMETGIPPVCYVPPEDIAQEYLTKTDHSTHCPFKGDASYWTINVGDRELQNAIWAYESPIEAATPIKGHMAFYANLVDTYEATHSA